MPSSAQSTTRTATHTRPANRGELTRKKNVPASKNVAPPPSWFEAKFAWSPYAARASGYPWLSSRTSKQGSELVAAIRALSQTLKDNGGASDDGVYVHPASRRVLSAEDLMVDCMLDELVLRRTLDCKDKPALVSMSVLSSDDGASEASTPPRSPRTEPRSTETGAEGAARVLTEWSRSVLGSILADGRTVVDIGNDIDAENSAFLESLGVATPPMAKSAANVAKPPLASPSSPVSAVSPVFPPPKPSAAAAKSGQNGSLRGGDRYTELLRAAAAKIDEPPTAHAFAGGLLITRVAPLKPKAAAAKRGKKKRPSARVGV